MRRLGFVIAALFLCTALVSTQTKETSAATTSCSSLQTSVATMIGGSCYDWTIKLDAYGKFVGAIFKSTSDTYLKAPITGEIDTSCGKLWSTSSTTRRIWVTGATYWKYGQHTGLCTAPLTSAQAADKYNAGPPTSWTRIVGSQSTGWIYKGAPEYIYCFHGRVDYNGGYILAGQWTPVQVTAATGWYFSN